MYDDQTAELETGRRRWRISPGVVVLALFVALLVVVIVGVAVNGRSKESTPGTLTIAELQADPDRYDDQLVTLVGRAEDERTLPYLDQYATYTFRDDTGTLRVLSQKGTPPGDGRQVRLTGTYHARATLDKELRRLVEAKFGPLAGGIVALLLPGVSLNVVFLEHQRYALND